MYCLSIGCENALATILVDSRHESGKMSLGCTSTTSFRFVAIAVAQHTSIRLMS
jgi:hypothetical protein